MSYDNTQEDIKRLAKKNNFTDTEIEKIMKIY